MASVDPKRSAAASADTWQWWPVQFGIAWSKGATSYVNGRVFEQSQENALIVARWLMMIEHQGERGVSGEGFELERVP